jgi:Uma2 family endonuclease
MPDSTPLVTAEQLERQPDDDFRYELVEGRVIRMSPVGFQHGDIVIRFASLISQHARACNLGSVVTEVGFKLASNPDTVRAPDIAFLKRQRIPCPVPRGFWQGAPDLAVEVLSPDDAPADIRAKVGEYLAHDVPVVVVVDPDAMTATTYRRQSLSQVLSRHDLLDLDDAVAGFRCQVREIFE